MMKHQTIEIVDMLFRLTVVGVFSGYFFLLISGSPIASFLLMNTLMEESNVLNIELFLAFSVLSLASLFVWRNYFTLAISLTVFLVFYPAIEYLNGGEPLILWALVGALARASVPFLAFWHFKMKNDLNGSKQKNLALTMRLFLALIFLSHGIAALKLHPVYIDYIIGFSFSLSNYYISQQSAEHILIAIGVLDIISAVGIVFFLKKPLLYWLILWGFVTAFLRIVDAGWMNFPEFLIRIPHFFIPLILLLSLFKSQRKHHA